MSMDTRTRFHSIVISDKDCVVNVETLNWWLSCNTDRFAWIYHDCDEDAEKQPKTPHYHIVAIFAGSRRLSSVVKSLSQALDIDPFAISNRRLVDIEKGIQYLIHKNDPDKYQYPVTDIYTNWEKDEFKAILESEGDGLNFEKVCDIVDNAKSIREVIKACGWSYYYRWRPAILDLWNTRGDYKE